jgi:flagellar biogenesis protein FliO
MPPSFWAAYVEKLAIVAVVLTTLYVVARSLRQLRFFARAGRSLSLVDSLMLSQHAALHVVRAGARYFLVGSAAAGLSTLAELTPGDVEEAAKR